MLKYLLNTITIIFLFSFCIMGCSEELSPPPAIEPKNVPAEVAPDMFSAIPPCKHPVADYLTNSGLQIETPEQLAILEQAMKDINLLNTDELKKKRYKSFLITEEQWDLPALFYAYIIPGKLCSNFESDFWRDISSLGTKSQSKEVLQYLKQMELGE